MKIILIGNYNRDQQESMFRFANMLYKGFTEAGISTTIWKPVVFFGYPFRNTNHGIGKWLGYIDKWLLFPVLLRFRILFGGNGSEKINFHICDHSNAPYLAHLPANRTVITCHDVIAIRAGLGHADTYVSSSPAGKIFQKWILRNLLKAKKIATVSFYTLNQLRELAVTTNETGKKWIVIHNAFNGDFRHLSREQSIPLLKKAGIPDSQNYILHVGSALQRKNRKLLLNMVSVLGDKWNGKICYAGKPLDGELMSLSHSLHLSDRVISVVHPDHDTLTALYSCCDAFVFPSFSEGFGWPVIEAQACGVPVIASKYDPMPEVSGGYALHGDPFNAENFAGLFLTLKDEDVTDKLVAGGYENIKRFRTEDIIAKYLELHHS